MAATTRTAAPRPRRRRAPQPPLDRTQGGLRNLRDFQRDPVAFLDHLFGDGRAEIADVFIGPRRVTFLLHPDHLEHVLIRNAKSYVKDTPGYTMMRKVLGRGLITSDGDLWRRQRRIAQPAFHKQRIASFASLMSGAAERMVRERWIPAAHAGTPVDVSDEMMRITLEIVSETMLGLTAGRDADAVASAMPVVLEHIVHRTLHLAPHEIVPTPRNLRYRRALRALDEIVGRIIRERRAGGRTEEPGTADLLDMLMEARDEETGEGMSDRQLRDEVMTMYLAGHETTAVALAWTFYLLHRHPEWDARVREELDRVLCGRTPGLDDLGSLDVTRRVIEEAMRLYPPVWMIGRAAVADDEVGGYRIPKGRLVFAAPWVTHRRPDLFSDPERFDPDRFLPERRAALPRLAYFPFSAGQRKCIGDHFAMMEVQLILATVLPRFRFELARPEPVAPEATVTVRVMGGLPMRLTLR